MPPSRLQRLLSQLPRLNLDVQHPLTMSPLTMNLLTTFCLFMKLPPELRNMIWKYAAMGQPRDIKRYVAFPYHLDHLDDVTTVPAILHVSWESRREGLRYYEPVYLAEYTFCPEFNDYQEPFSRGYIYINWATDIFFDACQDNKYIERFDCDQLELNRVRHIGLNYTGCFCDLQVMIRQTMSSPGLYGIKTFTLVMRDSNAVHATNGSLSLDRELFKEEVEARMRKDILQALGVKSESDGPRNEEIEVRVEWRVSTGKTYPKWRDIFQRYIEFSKLRRFLA